MARRFYAVTSVVVVFGTVIACVGEDPQTSSTSSSSGSNGDAGPSGPTKCSAASPCATGTCVDGFCCDSGCTGVCESCSVAGSEGKCTALKGKPTHGKCDGDADGICAGSCDGTNRAACTYPDVECGKGSCANDVAVIPPKCSAGTCPAPQTQACALIGCSKDSCLSVKQIAADYAHICAAMTDGTVRCWGDNSIAQCGSSGGGEVATPTEVKGLTDVVGIAAANGATCALIKDGTVQCWGANNLGQLGANIPKDAAAHPTPVLVNGVSGATFIGGASGSHFCAIVANGAIRCWGGNLSGQLGTGIESDAEIAPNLAVCAPGSTAPNCSRATGAKFVAGGDNYTCAILANDEVACWGNNGGGQTGQVALGKTQFPTIVAGLTAKYLAAGNAVTCAVSGNGLKCFGSNGISGRIGNCDNTGGKFSDPQVVGASEDCKTPLTGVTGVSTSDESVCGVANGAVMCWGSGNGGQFGDGSSDGTNLYAKTKAIETGGVYVASGGALNYAIVQNGVERDVRCWGSESSSQCGTGTASATRLTPVAPKWK